MRKFHRWFSLPAAILLLLTGLTGVVMQVMELTGDDDHDRPAAAQATLPDEATLASLLGKTLAAAHAADPKFKGQKIELSVVGGETKGKIAGATPRDPSISVDLTSGKVEKMAGPPPRDAYKQIMGWHSGHAFGPIGKFISLLVGLSLVILSFTGLMVYIDMFRRRKSANKKGLFWS